MGESGIEVELAGQRCNDDCIKFATEWIGDGVCDHDCAQCPSYTKFGVFDGGDCGTAEAAAYESLAMAHGQEGFAPGSVFVNVMAAFGLAVTAYGAFRHYVK